MFLQEKLVFNVNIKPTCPRYILHILHRHPSGTLLPTLNLKALSGNLSSFRLPYFAGY